MKTYIIFFLCLACCNCLLPTNRMLMKWNIFKLKYNKTYTEPEDKHRQSIFFKNLIDFEKHNAKYRAGLVSYKKGVNKFADMTPKEFLKTLYPINIDDSLKPTHRFLPRASVRVPEEVDWRRKGAVTAVRNQDSCGSCWTFSVAGAIEGQLFLKKGLLVRLSVQNLLDCSSTFGKDGCEGGVPSQAYQFVQQYGIDTDESYPYENRKGQCRFNPYTVGAKIAGFADVAPNEHDLKIAVAMIGPISAGLNSVPLQHYHSGISDFPYCDKNLNHAVLIVGYGSENGKDYWIIKNSWGVTFGEGGYARISRNNNNYCGIASLASYPIL